MLISPLPNSQSASTIGRKKKSDRKKYIKPRATDPLNPAPVNISNTYCQGKITINNSSLWQELWELINGNSWNILILTETHCKGKIKK